MAPPDVPGVRGMPLPPPFRERQASQHDERVPSQHDVDVEVEARLAAERSRDAKRDIDDLWSELDAVKREVVGVKTVQITMGSDIAAIKKAVEEKKSHKLAWISAGAVVLAAAVGGAFSFASDFLKTAREQSASAGAAGAASAIPAGEARYREGFRDGSKAIIDEQLARLQANPPPLGATVVASAPKTR